MRKLYTGEIDLPSEVSDALATSGLSIVPEVAPADADPQDLVLLAARDGISSEARHALNNPLTAVLGFAELLLRQDDLSPQVREKAERILKHGRQVRDLINKPKGDC